MLDANELERMAKARPDECFLKGSGVLKLIGAIRQLEAELRALRPDGAVLRWCGHCGEGVTNGTVTHGVLATDQPQQESGNAD